MVQTVPTCPMCNRPMVVLNKAKTIEKKEKSSKFWTWKESFCENCNYTTSEKPTIVETSWS